MGLETNVQSIGDLDASNPLPTDGGAQGDDHIRLIKSALKSTFPNVNAPIDLSDEDFNDIPNLIDQAVDRIYPVGGLYFTTKNEDPATTLGVGTWARFGAGRAIVGYGTANGVSWDNKEEKGSATHTLTTSELPSHHHTADPPSQRFFTNATGSHQHSYARAGGGGGPTGLDGSGTDALGTTGAAGNHQHHVDVNLNPFNTQNSGSGTAHNNIQPSIAVFMWIRTE